MRPAAAVAVTLLGLGISTNSLAGRDPEEWDDLPQVVTILFSEVSIGLVVSDGRQFVLDRKTDRLEQIAQARFRQTFGGSTGAPAAVTIQDTGINSTVGLRASGGKEFVTKDAYCSEGEDSHHTLSLDGRPIKDHVDPCSSVSAVEIVGDQLWLGTRTDAEYGAYPAEGVVVQSLHEGRALKVVGKDQGLTGNLVTLIRLDPFSGSVWIATNEGINEVTSAFRVLRSLYVHEELDPQAGIAVRLTTVKQKSNPLAPLFRALKVADGKRFYEATRSIPLTVQERGLTSGWDPGAPERERAFVPAAMNVLVPFFIEAAKSTDPAARQYALFNMCRFNDKRLSDFLREKSRTMTAPGTSQDAYYVRKCLDKYIKYGLIDVGSRNEQLDVMLRQEREALDRIRAQDSYPGLWGDYQVVVDSAKGLKAAGDPRGMSLINDHFKASDGNRRDANVYEIVGQQLLYENEIIPAMLEGLRKVRDHNVSRGCQYFDMRWDFMPRRYSARYAAAILAAIDQRAPQPAPRTARDDYCVEAFKAQMRDAVVRQDFMEDVYPALPVQQRMLADKLSPEPSAPAWRSPVEPVR